jgi:hypothetical protein
MSKYTIDDNFLRSHLKLSFDEVSIVLDTPIKKAIKALIKANTHKNPDGTIGIDIISPEQLELYFKDLS